MPRLTLIRHTKVRDPSVCYGQVDVALDPQDFAQSVALLKQTYPELTCIYSSPAKRCVDLAKALCPHVIVIDELLEMNFGNWQLKLWDDIERSEIDEWAKDVQHYRIPGGENCVDFYNRTKQGFNKLPANAIVIAHGGTIRSAFYHFGGLNFDQSAKLNIEHGQSYHIK